MVAHDTSMFMYVVVVEVEVEVEYLPALGDESLDTEEIQRRGQEMWGEGKVERAMRL